MDIQLYKWKKPGSLGAEKPSANYFGIVNKKNLHYYFFQLSNILSTLGSRCAQLSTIWLIILSSKNAFNIAYIMGFSAVLTILFLPILGPLADMFSKRKLLLLTDMGKFISISCIFLMVYFHKYNLSLLIIFYSGFSILNSLRTPIERSAIHTFFPQPKEFNLAFRVSTASQSLGAIIGIIASGSILYKSHEYNAFLTSMIFFVFSFFLILCSHIKEKKVKNRNFFCHSDFKTWYYQFKNGIYIIMGVKLELIWLFFSFAINLFLSPLIIILLPFLIKNNFSENVLYLSILESSLALGMILSSLFITNYINKFISSSYGIVGAIFFVGLIISTMTFYDNIYFLFIGAFFIGIFMAYYNVNSYSKRLMAMPIFFHNRLNAAIQLFSETSILIGTFMISIMLNYCGLTLAFILSGISICILSPILYFFSIYKIFMKMDELSIKNFYYKKYCYTFTKKPHNGT